MIVLDCSVTMTWLFPEEATSETDELAQHVTREGAHVPLIWHWEVANSVATALRKNRLSPEKISPFFLRLNAMPIETDMLGYQAVNGSIFKFARTYSLTVYDASYLELASRLILPLATLDKKLASTAMTSGIKTLLN